MKKHHKKKGVKKKSVKKKVDAISTSATLVPIAEPNVENEARVDRVFSGQPIAPIERVKLFSADVWEQFIREWVHSLKDKYHTVLQCSGSGDMGRDVVAYTGAMSGSTPWDNYQCKHYNHRLRPNEIWIELGKLVHYTFQKEFTIPREYFFVCPNDVSTSLVRMFEQPDELRDGLIANWNKKCRMFIRSEEIMLTGDFKRYVKDFPFEIVSCMPVLKVIEQHRQTPWYVHRFGGGLPDRPDSSRPPETIATNEVKYVSELLRAYSNNRGATVDGETLESWPLLEDHFLVSRVSFYSAESLKSFSRDHLPDGEYSRLQNQIYDGVQETYLEDHDDGFRKVVAVVNQAINMQITNHPLLPVLESRDRRGICHQLVDLEKLIWVENHA